MGAAVPRLVLMGHEPQIGFVHQRRGLKDVSGTFGPKLLGGKSTEIRIDQFEQLPELRTGWA